MLCACDDCCRLQPDRIQLRAERQRIMQRDQHMVRNTGQRKHEW
jgi:hypothetical protein